MVIRFDSLDRAEVPLFTLCSPGCKYQNGVLTNASGILSATSDEEIVFNFNAPSELNMRVYKIKTDDAQEQKNSDFLFRTLRNRRLIFVEDIGFFMITSVDDGYSEGIVYKDIHAESCEVELREKNMPYVEDGTYLFGNLLDTVLSACPGWSIRTENDVEDIDNAVAGRYRTFEDVAFDANVLGFMLEDMQDAYECIFLFDPINREISVRDQYTFAERSVTSIHITNDDLIDGRNITESSDDLYTALSVEGDNNLNIAAVNPLGTNVIYNFSYYLDWMSPALSAKVAAWQSLVDNVSQDYYEANATYYSLMTQKEELEAELARLDTQLTQYQRCRENIVAEAGIDESGIATGDISEIEATIDSYNEVIEAAGGEAITA